MIDLYLCVTSYFREQETNYTTKNNLYVNWIWEKDRCQSEVLDLLKNNYVNNMVIQAFADAFHQKVVTCTVHGVCIYFFTYACRNVSYFNTHLIYNSEHIASWFSLCDL